MEAQTSFRKLVEGKEVFSREASEALGALIMTSPDIRSTVATRIIHGGYINPVYYRRIPLWMQNLVWTEILSKAGKGIMDRTTFTSPGLRLFQPQIAMERLSDPMHLYVPDLKPCVCGYHRMATLVWGWRCIPHNLSNLRVVRRIEQRMDRERSCEAE